MEELGLDIYTYILDNENIQILLNSDFYSSIYPGGIFLAQIAKSALFFAYCNCTFGSLFARALSSSIARLY